MSTNFCQTCKNEAKLICSCTQIYLCEQCIGQHLLKNFTVKHRPSRIVNTLTQNTSLEQTIKSAIKSAIQSKLTNEVLEIEEFRKISLQKISEMLQMAEKELLETVEHTMNSVSDRCESVQRDLKNSLALLMLPEMPQNAILDMFSHCASPDTVRDLKIVHKDLDLLFPEMKEIINNAIRFSLQVTLSPDVSNKCVFKGRSNSNSSFRSALVSTKGDEMNYSSPSILSKASTMTASNFISKLKPTRSITPKRPLQPEVIEMELKNSLKTTNSLPEAFVPLFKPSALLFPFVVYFFPNSNRFTIYNAMEAEFKDVELPNKIFLPNSSWCISEDGKIVQTGGFDTRPHNDTFIFKISTQSVEKSGKLMTKRYKHSQISLGNFVYAIGGCNKTTLSSVERLNLLNNKWKKVGNMCIRRSFPAVCTHLSKIYVAGGTETKSIEVFSSLTKKFLLLPVMLYRPSRICMFSYDDKIHLLQGNERFEWSGLNDSIRRVGEIEERSWYIQGESYVMNNEIYFITDSILFRYDLPCSQISVVKALSI